MEKELNSEALESVVNLEQNLIYLPDGSAIKGYPINPTDSTKTDNTLRLDTTGEYLTSKRDRSTQKNNNSTEDKKAEEELFTSNAFLFVKHIKRIFSDSRMFLAQVPIQSGIAYTGTSGFQKPTLGIYLEWWCYCSRAAFTEKGKRCLIYHIAGSPLSGSNHCGVVNEDGKTFIKSFSSPFKEIWGSFIDVNTKYDEAKEHFQAYTLKEVVDILKEIDEQQ